METMENNLPSATHEEKAKKMKKLRRWQIAISLLGVAIIVWGVIEVICLFLNYSQTETSNDAQIEQYVSPINLRASGYIDKIYFTEHQFALSQPKNIQLPCCFMYYCYYTAFFVGFQ